MEPELSAGSAENGYLAKRKRTEFKIANIDFEEDFNQVISNNSNIKIKKIE